MFHHLQPNALARGLARRHVAGVPRIDERHRHRAAGHRLHLRSQCRHLRPLLPTQGVLVFDDTVLECLNELFITRGLPSHIRRDIGSEFTATILRKWLKTLDVKTAFIEPGSPWENGLNERFNGSLRDECLNRERFYTLKQAQILIESWHNEYNHIRPDSGLNCRPPAPRVLVITAVGNTPPLHRTMELRAAACYPQPQQTTQLTA